MPARIMSASISATGPTPPAATAELDPLRWWALPVNTVVGSSGVSGEDAGSAAGLFLTTAQSSIALGVAVIGGVFFSRLGTNPTPVTYLHALSSALACNLILQAATFLLVFWLPRAGRSPKRS
jgi:hypothetical protein